MAAWKVYVVEEKKEKLKRQQKEQMWDKVNGWLNEYKENKDKRGKN